MDVSVITQSQPGSTFTLFDVLQGLTNLVVAATAIGALWHAYANSKQQQRHQTELMNHERLKMMPRLVQTNTQDDDGQEIGLRNVGLGPAEIISVSLYKRVGKGHYSRIALKNIEDLSQAILKELADVTSAWQEANPDAEGPELFQRRQFKQSIFGSGVIVASGESQPILKLYMPAAVHPALRDALAKFKVIAKYRNLLGGEYEIELGNVRSE